MVGGTFENLAGSQRGACLHVARSEIIKCCRQYDLVWALDRASDRKYASALNNAMQKLTGQSV
jgi:hypothetical protein